MTAAEVKHNIGGLVRLTDERNHLDGIYKLTALIIRKNDSGQLYCQAEIRKMFSDSCLMYVRPEQISLLIGEQEIQS